MRDLFDFINITRIEKALLDLEKDSFDFLIGLPEYLVIEYFKKLRFTHNQPFQDYRGEVISEERNLRIRWAISLSEYAEYNKNIAYITDIMIYKKKK